MNALLPLSTTHSALSSTPVLFASDMEKVRYVRVYSNVDFHVALNDSVAVTDMPVSAGYHGVVLHVDAGVTLSAVKASAAADGDVWFTVVKRF